MPAERPRNPSIRRLTNRLFRLFDRHLGRLEQESGIVRRHLLPDGRRSPAATPAPE